MSIKIEVRSIITRSKAGVSKRTGKPYEMTLQRAWLHGSKDYPTEVEFVLGKEQAPFAAGYYVADAPCVSVNPYGECRLELNRMVPLRKVEAA